MSDQQAKEELKKSMTPEKLAELIADNYGSLLNSDDPLDVSRRFIDEYGFETVLETVFDYDPLTRDEVISSRLKELSDSVLDIARALRSKGDDYSPYTEAVIYPERYVPNWSRKDGIGVILCDGSYMALDGGADCLDWRDAVDSLPVGEYTVVGSRPLVDEVIERLRARGSKAWDEKSAAEWDDEEESNDTEA